MNGEELSQRGREPIETSPPAPDDKSVTAAMTSAIEPCPRHLSTFVMVESPPATTIAPEIQASPSPPTFSPAAYLYCRERLVDTLGMAAFIPNPKFAGPVPSEQEAAITDMDEFCSYIRLA